MKLKSFGCSFIFGTDLSDDTNGIGEPFCRSSQLTWPALLAQHWNYVYECHARPSSGNLRILEKVLSHAIMEPAFFVIGWSWIDRFDYLTDTTQYPKHRLHPYDLVNEENVWQTITPGSSTTHSEFYYKNLHTQYRDKFSTLLYMRTAVDVLNQRQIPFIMTYMDELTFEQQFHTNSAVLDLQNYLRPYMTTFEGKTFLEYSLQHDFPVSSGLHPLEPAHQAAFELIKDHSF